MCFKEYLIKIVGLCEKSAKDSCSRLRIMELRNIDYTKDITIIKSSLINTNLAPTTQSHCITVSRHYKRYLTYIGKR